MSTAGQAPAGTIETLGFARLLARSWERGFTGSFRARSEVRPGTFVTKEILFERGKIAWAASDSPDESIRAFLLSRGLLGADQWRLAEEKAAGSQTRQVLLELGFLSPRELKNADRERVTSIVLGLFAWKEGEYAVAPGPLPPGTPVLKIDPRDLVLEGFMASGDRERVLDEIGSLDAVFVVRPDDLVRASLSLPVEMAELMSRADGTRSVAEICALSPLPDFLISATLAALKILGLAQPLQGEPGMAPPAPPRPAPSSGRTRPRKRADGPGGSEPRLPYEAPGASAQEAAAAAETIRIDPPDLADPASLADASAIPDHGAHETLPMAQTPPEGLPPVAAGPNPAAEGGNERRENGVVKRTTDSGKVIWVSELIDEDEDPDPLWNVVTPPKIRATKPLSDEERNRVASGEPPGDYGDPAGAGEPGSAAGVPADSHPTPIRSGSSPDLDVGEIEDAIGMLGGGEVTGGPPEGERFESEDREDHETMGSSDREPFGEEPIETDEEPSLEAGDEAGDPWPESGEPGPSGGEDETWVYVPSGAEGSESVSPRDRLIRWSGVAVAMLGLLVVVAVMISGRTDAVHTDAGQEMDSPGGPPPVDTPSASLDPEPDAAEAGAPEEIAAQTDSQSPVESPAAPSRALPEPGAREPRIAAAGGDSGLASPGQGDIFQSATFQQGRSLLEQGRLRDAADRFAAAWSGRSGLYTLQLALACEPKTVTRALGSAGGATEFFILPKTYRGRSCYRLLWGSFPGRDAALGAAGSVPRAFRESQSPPFPAPL